MKTTKEKAINLILLGIALKFIPLFILGLLGSSNSFSYSIILLITGLFLGFFLVGYVFFIKGCCLYCKGKGYSSKLGCLGLLSLLGLSVLLLIPSQKNAYFLQEDKLVNNPFDKINIPEILLYLFALTLLGFPALGIVSLLSNLSFSSLINNPNILQLLNILAVLCWGFVVFRKSQRAGLTFNKIIGYENRINFKLILAIVIIIFAFRWSSNSLTLYGLSFVFPGYVEKYINEKNFTSILGMLGWVFGTIILVPLIYEFFIRGIVLQKWTIKWGVKTGILASSLLFAVFHFGFNIISSFIMGIVYSILYFKSRNLMTSILCRFFHNTLFAILTITKYLNTPEIKRSTLISAKDFQDSIQPLLGQRVFLVAISIPFLIYFVYKNFPRNNAIIPYYANDAKSDKTN